MRRRAVDSRISRISSSSAEIRHSIAPMNSRAIGAAMLRETKEPRNSTAITTQTSRALAVHSAMAPLISRARRASRPSSSRSSACCASALEELILQLAAAVDDAPDAVGEHAEQAADAGEQEDGRDGELDRMRDTGDRGVHDRLLRAPQRRNWITA